MSHDVAALRRNYVFVSEDRLDRFIVYAQSMQVSRESEPVGMPALLVETSFFEPRLDHTPSVPPIVFGRANRRRPYLVKNQTKRTDDRYHTWIFFVFRSLGIFNDRPPH